MKQGHVDLRYPFISLGDFLSGGYYSIWPAYHLLFACCGILLTTAIVLFLFRKARLFESLAVLSVVLTPYSNPAFMIYSLTPSDFFAVCGVAIYIFGLFTPRGVKVLPVKWICFWFLIAIHSIFVFLYYDLGGSYELFQRAVLVLRPIIAIIIATNVFRLLTSSYQGTRNFLKCLCFSLSISAMVYLIQMGIFESGTVPFGTMPSAGFGGVRFGGVSNEGGHLAKLSFPLLVLLLLLSNSFSAYFATIGLIFIYLLNVSATGYVAFLVLISAYLILKFNNLLWKIGRRLKILVAAMAFACVLASFNFKDQILSSPVYYGLINKLVDAVDRMWSPKDDIYGRSPLIATAIIDKYPLGIGYAGSTQRNIVMRDFDFVARENNLGLNVALASWSIFSIIVFVFLSINFVLGWVGATIRQRAVILSLLTLISIDVLWSNSAIYVAFFLASQQVRFSRNSGGYFNCHTVTRNS